MLIPQRRDRETLRRRRDAEKETAGEAEEREGQDEAIRQRQHPAKSIRGGAEKRAGVGLRTLEPLQKNF